MTMMVPVGMKCAVCGTVSEHEELLSSNEFGSSDLDTRPPEMFRSTISTWVRSCPSCGYCAPDITKRIAGASDFIKTDTYREQLKDPTLPELANAFLCYSMIAGSNRKFGEAGWACIHAAWSCDDSNDKEGAKKCRIRAVDLLMKAKLNRQRFAEDAATETIIVIDLLRRSGQFEEAKMAVDEALKMENRQIILEILKFQRMLIRNKGMECYRIEEVAEYEK